MVAVLVRTQDAKRSGCFRTPPNSRPTRTEIHMISTGWNPWKITAIGLGLVTTIALIIGVGLANWSGREEPKPTKTRVAAVTPAPVATPPTTLPSQSAI